MFYLALSLVFCFSNVQKSDSVYDDYEYVDFVLTEKGESEFQLDLIHTLLGEIIEYINNNQLKKNQVKLQVNGNVTKLDVDFGDIYQNPHKLKLSIVKSNKDWLIDLDTGEFKCPQIRIPLDKIKEFEVSERTNIELRFQELQKIIGVSKMQSRNVNPMFQFSFGFY